MTQTSTGIKLSISSGIPATYGLSGYGALTYFEIGEVTNIPQFGALFQTVTNQPLATGITEKRKGFVNYGDPVIDMALDNSNMGQQMMKSACDGIRKSQVHAFMLQYGNGEIRYWSGRVFSFQEAPGSANNMVGATSQIGITRAIIQIPRITLDLSFAENFYSLGGEPKNFSDIITFSRSTTSAYFDQNGVMQTAAIDTPCLAYDPATLEPLGLQVFGAATNLLTYSEQFDNAAWQKVRSTISPNSTAAPDGTVTADKLVESTDSGTHALLREASFTSGSEYTFSFFAAQGERSWLSISPTNVGGVFLGGSVYINLQDGTIGQNASSISVKTEKAGLFYRVSVTAEALASGGGRFDIYSAQADGVNLYQGDGTSGIYIWGAQLETGSIATPYIKTEASQVTRAADIATVDDLSGWYNQSQGSVFVDGENTDIATNQYSASLGAGALAVFDNGTDSFAEVVGGASISTAKSSKKASSYNGSAYSLAAGGSYVTGGAGLDMSAATTLHIGSNGGVAQTNGYIKTLNYYPSALTENEMKLITL